MSRADEIRRRLADQAAIDDAGRELFGKPLHELEADEVQAAVAHVKRERGRDG